MGRKKKPYTDADLRRIERDPVLLRGYFWQVAMNARKIAAEQRNLSRRTGITHPTTNYRPAFHEGRDMIADADLMERVSAVIMENLDVFVETTLVVEKKGVETAEG